MNRSILVSMIALSLWACGPDAMAVVGDEEVDGNETYDAQLTSSSRSMTWFPLQAGNSWTFRNSAGTTRTVTVTSAGDNMALVTGLYADPMWMGMASDASTTLQQWNSNTSVWEPLVRFGYASTTWKTNSTTCKGLVGKRSATGTLVTTPAGTFTDTRTISYAQISSPTMMCAPQQLSELTFVPNVGLVSFKTGTNQRFTLVSATINGVSFPAAAQSDVSANVVLDHASYSSVPNTIRCITTPCPSNADTAVAKVELQLKNTGSTSATWQFSTGCQFDVEVVAASGRVVRRLSDGRSCTFALSSLTLGAGQSKVYSASVPLEDSNGLQLSGTYTVRAKLIPSSNASTAPSATSSLSVVVLTP